MTRMVSWLHSFLQIIFTLFTGSNSNSSTPRESLPESSSSGSSIVNDSISSFSTHSRRLSSFASDFSSTSSRDFSDVDDMPNSPLDGTPSRLDHSLTSEDTDASSTCSTIMEPSLDFDDFDAFDRESTASSTPEPPAVDTPPSTSPRDTPTLLEVARGAARPIDRRVVEDECRRKKDIRSRENEKYEKVLLL